MSIDNGLVILAILASPILAFQVQCRLEARREKRNRKLWLFRTLMATRGATTGIEHVQALNMIDVTFTDKKDRAVLSAWRKCLEQRKRSPEGSEESASTADIKARTAEIEAWEQRSVDRLVDLLAAMGESLGIASDLMTLKQSLYVPRLWSWNATAYALLANRIIDICQNSFAIPVSLVSGQGAGASPCSQSSPDEAVEKHTKSNER